MYKSFTSIRVLKRVSEKMKINVIFFVALRVVNFLFLVDFSLLKFDNRLIRWKNAFAEKPHLIRAFPNQVGQIFFLILIFNSASGKPILLIWRNVVPPPYLNMKTMREINIMTTKWEGSFNEKNPDRNAFSYKGNVHKLCQNFLGVFEPHTCLNFDL